MNDPIETPAPIKRWNGPVEAPRFAMIPDAMLFDIARLLSPAQFKVFYVLVHTAYGGAHSDVAAVSYRDLARTCAMATRTVRLCLSALEGFGLIEPACKGDEGPCDPNSYRVLLTRDARYVSRKGGGSLEHRGEDPLNTGGRIPRTRQAPSVLLSTDIRGERTRAHKEKYFRGTYAVCPDCNSRPCSCGG